MEVSELFHSEVGSSVELDLRVHDQELGFVLVIAVIEKLLEVVFILLREGLQLFALKRLDFVKVHSFQLLDQGEELEHSLLVLLLSHKCWAAQPL